MAIPEKFLTTNVTHDFGEGNHTLNDLLALVIENNGDPATASVWADYDSSLHLDYTRPTTGPERKRIESALKREKDRQATSSRKERCC